MAEGRVRGADLVERELGEDVVGIPASELGVEAVRDDAVFNGIDAGRVIGVQFGGVKASFAGGGNEVFTGFLGLDNQEWEGEDCDKIVGIV